ncbi:MAG: hypothetical protein IPO29_18170 [Anaerolineae bacterium]|nr:hypothetical protein [Anaerolineae bacterium]
MKQPKTPTRIGPLLLLALIGAAVLALFAATSAVSALAATRVDLPEVAIPLVKCDGFNSCRNIVDLSQVADGSCNGTTGVLSQQPIHRNDRRRLLHWQQRVLRRCRSDRRRLVQ